MQLNNALKTYLVCLSTNSNHAKLVLSKKIKKYQSLSLMSSDFNISVYNYLNNITCDN